MPDWEEWPTEQTAVQTKEFKITRRDEEFLENHIKLDNLKAELEHIEHQYDMEISELENFKALSRNERDKILKELNQSTDEYQGSLFPDYKEYTKLKGNVKRLTTNQSKKSPEQLQVDDERYQKLSKLQNSQNSDGAVPQNLKNLIDL